MRQARRSNPRRSLRVALITLGVLGLAACGTDETAQAPATPPVATTPETTPPVAAPTPPVVAAGAPSMPSLNRILGRLGITAFTDSAGSCAPAPVDPSALKHFTGSLHEHTAYSDGTLNTAPRDVFRQVADRGFDFAFITDHSDTFQLPFGVGLADSPETCLTAPQQCFLSDVAEPQNNFMKWAAMAAQADAATRPANGTQPGFTATRGFEWTSDRFGHINVLFSSNYINAKLGPGYLLSMEGFWQWFLAPAAKGGGGDGLIVFNHPGREDLFQEFAQNFGAQDRAYAYNDFAYEPLADFRTVGVEVFGKGEEYDLRGPKQSWMAHALDKGWFLAAAGSEDHHGTDWGAASLPKTVIVAPTIAREDLRQAMLARRFYAVAQNFNNIRLDFNILPAGSASPLPMGSRLRLQEGSAAELAVVLGARPGTEGQALSPDKALIEILSSQANNADLYTPLSSNAEAVGGSRSTLKSKISVRGQRDWFFVRVRDRSREGSPIVAVSAPIWVEAGNSPLPQCPAR